MNDLFGVVPEIDKGKFFSHEKTDAKDEWLTPPELIRALGEFDLDPCSPINRPWPTARQHFTILDNGLIKTWSGRVWCNPPYGDETSRWMGRLAEHGNGIAPIFARTETQTFFQHIWPKADAIMFLKGRLSFYTVEGKKGDCAGAPSCLIAYGGSNVAALYNSNLDGRIVHL